MKENYITHNTCEGDYNVTSKWKKIMLGWRRLHFYMKENNGRLAKETRCHQNRKLCTCVRLFKGDYNVRNDYEAGEGDYKVT